MNAWALGFMAWLGFGFWSLGFYSILVKYTPVFKFVLLIVFVVSAALLARFFGVDFSGVRDAVEGFGMLGPAVFLGAYIAGTVVFLPGAPLTIAAGALFGAFWGTVYVILGATLGAIIAFVISRYLGEQFVARMLAKEKFRALSEYNTRMERHGLGTVLFLRLVPLFPFNGLNFALGLTKVNLRHYAVGTLVGIVPGAFSYAYVGGAVASVNFFGIALGILLLATLSFIAFVYKKFTTLKENEFDIIVIGAGAGGLNIASFMCKAGFKTLLIDKDEAHIGGDCLNFGCVPSKALIHVSHIAAQARAGLRFGLTAGGAADMQKVVAYIKEKQNIIRAHENAKYFRAQGIHVAFGEARFVSKDAVSVSGKTYRGKKIVIATGARTRKLSIPGIEQAHVYTNETIFDIETLPKKLTVVGGGPIGLEIAQAFARLGSQVVVVQKKDMMLPQADPDAARVLQNQLKHEGIVFYFEHKPVRFEAPGSLVIANTKGKETTLTCDAVFVGIGRIPNVEHLDAHKAGIAMAGYQIQVDAHLRTTNKNVYVCGDAAGKEQFTHAAEVHAALILRNFFSPLRRALNMDHFSWVLYTDPQIATFGLSEAQLRKRHIAYEVLESDFAQDDRAIVDENTRGMVKLFIARDTLLGGVMASSQAGELFQELALAQSAGVGITQLFAKVYPYPTAGRINKKVLSAHFAKKLTGINKKILRVLFH